MASSNNPIHNTIRDVLGIGTSKPNTYQSKVDALNNKIKQAKPLVQELSQPNVTKKLSVTKPIVFFDLETTGLNVNQDQIFDAFFLKLNPDGSVEKLSQKLRPNVPISPEASKVTGVTQSTLESYGVSFKDVSGKLKQFLQGADLGGYNIGSFDVRLLQKEFLRAGIKDIDLGQRQIVDVFKLAQASLPEQQAITGGTKLSTVFEKLYGMPLKGAHGARTDVAATVSVLKKLLQTTNLPTTVSGLSQISEMSSFGTLKPIQTISDVFRADKFSMLEGSIEYRGQQISDLYSSLRGRQALPGEAASVFEKIRKSGGSLFYNPRSNALFFGKDLKTVTELGGEITALPVMKQALKGGTMVQMGTSTRAAMSAAIFDEAGQFVFKDFLSLFYGELSEQTAATSVPLISRAVKSTLSTRYANLGKISSLLTSSFTTRGMDTSFVEGRAVSQKYVLGFTGDEARTPILQALKNYRTSQSAFAMLVRTGGRSIFSELGLPTTAGYEEALRSIKQYKESYLGTKGKRGELAKTFQSIGALEVLPYIKPEYLGSKRLIAGGTFEGQFMGKMFGTQFEEHVVTKGLFQLSKISSTSSAQRKVMSELGENYFTPFILKGQEGSAEALKFGKLMKVGVAELEDQATSMLYFGESGGYYTESGERALKMVAPKGTLSISSPGLKTIEQVERLFGISLAKGNTQIFKEGIGVKFQVGDVEDALDFSKRFDSLNTTAADIRSLVIKEKKYRGFFGQLAAYGSDMQARLAKVSLSESKLSLDFVTAEGMTPNTVEVISGGRRLTLARMMSSNPFKNVSGGLQAIYAADEFAKTHGQLMLISNYIGVMQEQGASQAAEEFKKTFGFEAKMVSSGNMQKGGNMYAIPIVRDADTAMKQVVARLSQLGQGTDKERQLYKLVTTGSEVTGSMAIKGVKSIRSFYAFTGARTDFMSDINMLKPVRMTLSKMVQLGAAASQLGYGAGEDPLFKVFKGLSNPWKRGHLQLTSRYGQLALGEGHWLTRFSKALVTPESVGNLAQREVIRLGDDGGFYYKNKKGVELRLKDLPKDMSQFKYRAGGVPLKDLEGTILDTNLLKSDIMFLDLGKNVRADLLGGIDATGKKISGVTKEYRYLPLPMKAMRLEGMQGKLILSTQDSAYEMIEDLIDLQERRVFDPTKPIRYQKVIESMVGSKGLLKTTSDIMVSFGTRVRLSPQHMHNLDPKYLLDPDKLFEATVKRSELLDYLSRKEKHDFVTGPKGRKTREMGRHNAVLEAIREAIDPKKGKGYFLSSVGIDPTQRPEHINVFKIRVVDDDSMEAKQLARRRIGQLNLALHPLLPRMLERDLDKDVATLIPLEGLKIDKLSVAESQKLLESRYAAQGKLARHFMFFSYMQLKSEAAKPVAQRLLDLINPLKKRIVQDISDYVGQYIGTMKSLGYSITRGSESVMSALIDQGVEGAKDLGLLEKGFTEESILKAISPYVEEGGEGAVRLGVVKKLMQNVYQGAVQKGTSKETLIELAEDLLRIGQTYKGSAYDPVKAQEEGINAFKKFLMPLDESGALDIKAKNRMFMAMDYIVEKNIGSVTKESVEALKQDLIDNNFNMSDEIRTKFTGVFKQLNEAQAEILGKFFGTAMPLVSSVKRSYSGAIGIVQKTLSEGIGFTHIAETVLGGALGKSLRIKESAYPKAEESLATDIAKKVEDLKGGGLLGKIKNFLGKDTGKFALGVGVGAVAAATAINLFSGPEPMGPPPMPRDIDTRQPQDYGPEVSASAPRIYGNNQVFAASRNRSPETFSQAPRYNFGAGNDMRVTMRDKRAPTNPYLLEQQMNRVANRDFNY